MPHLTPDEILMAVLLGALCVLAYVYAAMQLL
jgi:hypothetical protein